MKSFSRASWLSDRGQAAGGRASPHGLAHHRKRGLHAGHVGAALVLGADVLEHLHLGDQARASAIIARLQRGVEIATERSGQTLINPEVKPRAPTA